MDMKVSNAVIAFVDFALPRFSDDDKLLHIPIDARTNIYFDDGEERDAYRDIHFLFHRPTNYTKVFIGINGWEYQRNPKDKFGRRRWVQVSEDKVFGPYMLNQIRWHMTSNHDSNWRSDGVETPLFSIGRDLHNEVTYGDDALFRKVNWNVCFDPLVHKIGYVNAKIVVDDEANDGRNNNYMRKPVNICEIEEETDGED